MLPEFGWSELLMIGIVLIVVIGPKDLPRVLRGFGKGMSTLRRMSDDFRKQMGDALKEAELDEVKKIADDVRGLDPRSQIRDAMQPLGKLGREIDADLKKAAGDLDAKPKSAAESALDASGDKMRAAQAKATDTATDAKPAAAKKPAAKPAAAKSANGKAPAKSASKPAAKTTAKTTRTKTTAKTTAKTTGAKPSAAKTTAKPRAAKPKAKAATTAKTSGAKS